jgi:ribosomal protein S18 acetylase RimI-like enzyme
MLFSINGKNLGWYLERFSIRKLEEQDVGFVYEMTVVEKWNDKVEDIRRMLSYEPNGCFMAETDGGRAGHVFTVSYGKLGWIGLLIVKADCRRIGIGRLLMEKAEDYLLSQGVETIKLEAVPEISNLYRTLGFVDEYDSLRFMGTCRNISSSENASISLAQQKDLGELARFDAEYFGAKRERVLTGLYQGNPRCCLVSHIKSEIVGYIICRRALRGFKVGPWVCDPENPQAARRLLIECMNRLESGAEVYVGVAAVNETAVKILQELRFEQFSKSIHMRLGKEFKDRVKGIFAIGDPMKG